MKNTAAIQLLHIGRNFKIRHCCQAILTATETIHIEKKNKTNTARRHTLFSVTLARKPLVVFFSVFKVNG